MMRDTFAVVRRPVNARKTAMNYDEKKCNSAASALRRAGGRGAALLPQTRRPGAKRHRDDSRRDLHERPRRGALV